MDDRSSHRQRRGTAITAEDYEEPITVKVDGAKVLSAAVTLTRPESFNPDIEKKTDSAVVIGKRLMNPRDMWELQLLTDGKPDVSLSCRIVGIHDAKLLKVPTDSWGRPYRSTALDWAIGVASSVALIVLGLTELGISDNVGSRLIAAFFFAVAAGWLPAILIRNTRRSRLFLP